MDRERKTLLIVEDDLQLQEIYEHYFKEAGLRVVPAFNGKMGIRRAAETSPDIVLLDVGLPDISGVDVLRALRASGATKSAFILMLTGVEDFSTKLTAFILGANRYLVKPMSLADLAKIIDHALNRPRAASADEDDMYSVP